MALQYYPVDIPIRTRLVLLLAIVMAGGFLFFRRRELLFPPIRFIPPRCFRVRKTPQSLARFLSPCRPRRLPSGEAFWSLPEQGRAAYTPYERSTPVRPVWNGARLQFIRGVVGQLFLPGNTPAARQVSLAVSILPVAGFLAMLVPFASGGLNVQTGLVLLFNRNGVLHILGKERICSRFFVGGRTHGLGRLGTPYPA